jgi:type VI secretion system FHA domain protein
VRADQKSTLRVPNTMIQPRANNPLKFSAGVDEALRNLLLRQPAEYLSAVEAVREAFRDVKVHQQSLLAALRTAIADYLSRLDPEDIESKYSGAKRGLISAANKLRYWDLYKDLYQVVTQAPPGQLPQLLVDDLLRAYEREAAKAAGALAKKSQAQAG